MATNTGLILPPAKTEGAGLIVENIHRILPLLPSGIDQQQFSASLVVAANELDKKCEPNSVLVAAAHACRVGLMPGGVLGLCYFIPRKERRGDQVPKCRLEIGYQGFLDLAYGNNFLADVHADVVLQGEEFRHWTNSEGPQLLHEPPDPLERDIDPDTIRRQVIGCYCIYHPRAGGRGIRVLNRKQLDRIDSKANVWLTNYDEMCRKSAIRRAAKDWKKTPRMALAMTLDEQAERGVVQNIGVKYEVDQAGCLDLDELEDV